MATFKPFRVFLSKKTTYDDHYQRVSNLQKQPQIR